MKKRFTLMMMVLCTLMCIPLKMMAQTETYDKITVKSQYKQNWDVNPNFVFNPNRSLGFLCVVRQREIL